MATGYAVESKDWDELNQRIKTSCKAFDNVTRINNHLLKTKQRVSEVLLQLEDEGKLETLSIKHIKSYITKGGNETYILEYGREIIDQLISSGRTGNARVYSTLLKSMTRFLKGRDMTLKHITYSWLKSYEAWYLGRGNSKNGLSVHMRTLRAVLNRAIKEGLLDREVYPFTDYSIKSEATRKRAITWDDLQRIIQFVPRTDRERRAKQYFLMSFYMMGASFVDLAHLKLKNVESGRVYYKRRKTGRLHSIPLTKPLEELIGPLLQEKTPDDYILSVIKSSDPKNQARNVRDELRRCNRALKTIGEVCEITTPLTSYVARHTYATLAKTKGIPTAIISEALGHSSEGVTQVYLDSFTQDKMDEYHARIILS